MCTISFNQKNSYMEIFFSLSPIPFLLGLFQDISLKLVRTCKFGGYAQVKKYFLENSFFCETKSSLKGGWEEEGRWLLWEGEGFLKWVFLWLSHTDNTSLGCQLGHRTAGATFQVALRFCTVGFLCRLPLAFSVTSYHEWQGHTNVYPAVHFLKLCP